MSNDDRTTKPQKTLARGRPWAIIPHSFSKSANPDERAPRPQRFNPADQPFGATYGRRGVETMHAARSNGLLNVNATPSRHLRSCAVCSFSSFRGVRASAAPVTQTCIHTVNYKIKGGVEWTMWSGCFLGCVWHCKSLTCEKGPLACWRSVGCGGKGGGWAGRMSDGATYSVLVPPNDWVTILYESCGLRYFFWWSTGVTGHVFARAWTITL